MKNVANSLRHRTVIRRLELEIAAIAKEKKLETKKRKPKGAWWV